MGIRCSKFHSDDLKTKEEVWDTNFLYYGYVWMSGLKMYMVNI